MLPHGSRHYKKGFKIHFLFSLPVQSQLMKRKQGEELALLVFKKRLLSANMSSWFIDRENLGTL